MEKRKPIHQSRAAIGSALRSRLHTAVTASLPSTKAADLGLQVTQAREQYNRFAKVSYPIGFVLLFVISILISSFGSELKDGRYELDAKASSIVGEASTRLVSKLSYDAKEAAYIYSDGEAAPKPGSKSSGSGKYQAKFPQKGSAGVTVTDPSSKVEVNLVPNFSTADAKNMNGHIVYPINGANAAAVYSIKGNGIKEDIIVRTYSGETMSFEYNLKLPTGVEARLTDGGEIGIYGGDSSLFGNITYGSDKDRLRVEAARKKAAKTNLLFVIPAPVISEVNEHKSSAKVKYELRGNSLKVIASRLDTAKYPLSIDPSMIVVSAFDLSTGTDEDANITYDTANGLIKRSGVSGGSYGSWANQQTYGGMYNPNVVINNGYIYRMGGYGYTGPLCETYFSTINGDGTLSDFVQTSSFGGCRWVAGAVALNNFMYVYGGYNGSVFLSDVRIAPINGDGTLGTFTTSGVPLPGTRGGFATVVNAGNIYITGGCASRNSPIIVDGITSVGDYSCNTYETSSYFIKPNAATGALPGTGWTPGTPLPAGSPQGSYAGMAVVRDNRMYVMGGARSDQSYSSTVYYATLDPTLGTMGTWSTGTPLYSPLVLAGAVIANDRLYMYGGSNGSTISTVKYTNFDGSGNLTGWIDTQNMPQATNAGGYAATSTNIYAIGLANVNGYYLANNYHANVNAGGGINSWTSSAVLNPVSFIAPGAVVVNGRAYFVGGPSANCHSTMSAAISTSGIFSNWRQEVFSGACFHNAPTVVTYNGYIYAYNGHLGERCVGYTKVKADGTLSPWACTTSMPTGRQYGGGTVYNGYLYMLGGQAVDTVVNGAVTYKFLNDVYYAKINANGTIGAWVQTASFATPRMFISATIANGYIYMGGGCRDDPPVNPGSCQASIRDMQYARINSDGSLNAWASLPDPPTNMTTLSMKFANGYLYIGVSNSGLGNNKVFYTPQYADGTLGAWQTGTNRPNSSTYGTTLLYDGYLYTVGGYGLGVIAHTKIDPPGSTYGWANSANTFSGGRQYSSTVINDGYIYVMGGCNQSCTLATDYYGDTQFAKINTDGSLSAWAPTGSFTSARAAASATVYNGRIYITGGLVVIGGVVLVQNEVQYALPSKTTGQISSWSVATPFGTSRSAHRAVANDGFMYVMGGCTNTTCGNTIADVQIGVINPSGNIVSWSPGRSLNNSRVTFGAIITGNKLYVLGGDNDGGNQRRVEWAALASDGTIGAWNVLAGIPTSLPYREAGFNFSKGYFYMAGGCAVSASACNVISSGVWRAALNPDNSIGSWIQTTSMLTATRTSSGQLPIYKDRVYNPGGCTATTSNFTCTAVTNITQSAVINNGGSGDTGAWTQSGQTMSTARQFGQSVAYNGYLYAAGGTSVLNAAPNLSSIQYTKLNNDGSLSPWQTATTSLPSILGSFGFTAYDGKLYIAGGYTTANAKTAETYMVPVNGDGNITQSWTAGPNLNTARGANQLVAYKGYLYTTGGTFALGEGLTSTEYIKLQPDGSFGISTWQLASNSFQNKREWHNSFIVNGYLYVVGGQNSADCSQLTNSVEYSQLATDGTGTPGSWKNATSLPVPTANGYGYVANGFMYYVGGCTAAGGGYTSSTWAAPIHSDGSIGEWAYAGSNVAANLHGDGGSAYWKGYIYQIGGVHNGFTRNYVSYAPLLSIPRTANYSKMFDTDVDTVANNYLIRGSAADHSGIHLAYRGAPQSTAVFGSPTFSQQLVGSVGKFTQTEARYHQMRMTLDDSQSGVFPDVNSTPYSVNNFELYYTSNPGKRLKGGKTFTSETPRTLHTIPSN